MTDPRTIAAGLDGGQRHALLAHPSTGYKGWPESARDLASWNLAGRHLKEKGLVEWHPDPRKTLTRLTRLGAQVKALLESHTP